MGVLDHCASGEYVPELLGQESRKDLKALNVTQPDGPSFKVGEGNLVEWQKWRFRVSFNPREGAVVHDVHYDGRSVVYRLSFSEMVSPYFIHQSRPIKLMCVRRSPTRTRAPHSTASKPSTSATAASATAPTTSSSAATAWA